MSNKGVGGRPRNAWTSSRRRKLVRLYTLSTLHMKDIKCLLEDDDFCPSVSDMQKKLRTLFSPDYAKDYRSFRPLNDSHMRLRVSRLRRWRHGKSRKSVGLGGSRRPEPTTRSRRMGLPLIPTTDASITGINPLDLQLDVQLEQSTVKHTESVFSQATFRISMEGLKDLEELEELQVSAKERAEAFTNGETLTDMIYGREKLTPRASQNMSPISLANVIDIGKRLRGTRSASYISRLNSIWRYSSSDSWRSSWSSFMSCVGSYRSGQSIHKEHIAARDQMGYTPSAADQMQDISNSLSEGEQMIWDELIDDEQLLSKPRILSESCHTSFIRRPCCQAVIGDEFINAQKLSAPAESLACFTCGFAAEHYYIRALHVDKHTLHATSESVSPEVIRFRGDINKRDNFGNTPLHFLAASGGATASWLSVVIDMGANIHAKNTRGETFMHVLRFDMFLDVIALEGYLKLVKYLLRNSFKIYEPDCYGRTIPEIFLKTSRAITSGPQASTTVDNLLAEILSLMKADSFHYFKYFTNDSLFKSLRDLFSDAPDTSSTDAMLYELLSDNGAPLSWSFAVLLERTQWNTFHHILFLVQKVGRAATAIDINGDTLLISTLKSCPDDIDEIGLKLFFEAVLDLGAGIHMRDRNGNSVLTIACCRGFRPVVKSLLRRGANVHVRNNKGQGILSQCRECIQKAQVEEHDKRYTRVGCCMDMIVDSGGKEEPTEIDEWMTPGLIRGHLKR